ncbi:eukaryotic translation initiation factor 5B-like [Helianthus annuus]|uniref:eukaryotic translation initiation factor 5B-like n=1 Tax=Helianthus annuus TaxID=4232 RepID=UPI000B8F5D32|nr:eukaryotic translation initiation factor 5B-like [Helianthus annuus]
MICKIDNPGYVALENDAWRHENNNSESEDNKMREMVEKKLRYWPSKKSPPRLVDELVVNPANISQEGIDLTKVTFEQYIKHTEVTIAKDQSASVQAEGVKEKEPEGVVHDDSSDADDESTEIEPEIDMLQVGRGKVQLKKKPQKKRKGSDEEDSTYTPTGEEKKKLRIKRKAVQSGVIARNVRARNGGASLLESQSGKIPKAPEVQSVEKPEVEKNVGDDDYVDVRVSPPPPPPKDQPIPESEYKDDILSGDEFDMFHDASVKALEKKVSILEKGKAKAEAERDELKKQLEELTKVNEEIKSVMIKQAKKLKKKGSELHEASANEFKEMKLEMEAMKADKAVKDEQLSMLYTVMEHHLGIDVHSIYNNIEIQRVEERSQPVAGGSSSQADVEMVDVEANQAQGFVLVGKSSTLSYNYDDIIRRVQVEQRKRKAKETEVLLLRWKEEEKVEEEEVKEDEDLDDVHDAIENYDPSWDDFIDKKDDDEDQGSSGLLIMNPSVQQRIEDFMNDEINEQEDH